MISYITSIENITHFDAVIDVRTPSEFQIDHIPGAINCPVMTDEQRVEVGTLHKHDVFEARRRGAAYISQNMAELLQTTFAHFDRNWRPLVYCWRGGMRSGSVVHIMNKVGWHAQQLKGGYKSYRRQVLSQLESLPTQFKLIVVCGPTGSGKSRFLNVLAAQGHQVLDLEGLAKHRGSLLGLIPGDTQPSQRYFETCLIHELERMDPTKPVYIESESKRIGYVSLPQALFDNMHKSPCIELSVPLEERIRFLCEDYYFYIDQPQILISKIEYLSHYRSKKEIDDWIALIQKKAFPEFIKELLEKHYDPLYQRSMHKNYAKLADAPKVELSQLDQQTLRAAADTFGFI